MLFAGMYPKMMVQTQRKERFDGFMQISKRWIYGSSQMGETQINSPTHNLGSPSHSGVELGLLMDIRMVISPESWDITPIICLWLHIFFSLKRYLPSALLGGSAHGSKVVKTC